MLTAGAPSTVETRPGEILIALPEAKSTEGAIRVPDLATALRRFPEAASVRVLGQGLTPRDQQSGQVRIQFDPPPQPPGVISFTLPGPVAPGAGFSVVGRIGTLALGAIELVDPSGAVADTTRVATGQGFVVRSGARTTGLALFTLRLRDRSGALVEEIAVPLDTVVQKTASRPRSRRSPRRTKYLRRWAEIPASN